MIAAKTVRFYSRYATSDPLGFYDIIRRRLVEAVSRDTGLAAVTRFGEVRFEVDLSMHKIAKKFYFHTHEMFLERIFRRHLQTGSVFIDIGANCGYWSAFALSLVGRSGAVHAFEPVPAYFASVKRLAELNPGYRISAVNKACGAVAGTARMAAVLPNMKNFGNYRTNIGSSSLADGFLDHARDLTTLIDVEIIPLDEYLAQNFIDLSSIGLIKIDVEGYEKSVLDGMVSALGKSGPKIPILCEVLTDITRPNPLKGADIVEKLSAFGYRCLDATSIRPVQPENFGFEENLICV